MAFSPVNPLKFGQAPHIFELPKAFKITNEGIVAHDIKEKELFTKECVDPLLQKLKTIKEQVQERKNKGYALADCLPTQTEIMELQDENSKLSEAWYGKGKGNCSLMYHFLIDVHEIAGNTA